MDSDVLKRTNVKSRCRKVMFASGLGGRSFWGRSSSPRGRRRCTSSISTTTPISGALNFLGIEYDLGLYPNRICTGKQGWTPWEDSGRHPEKLLRGKSSVSTFKHVDHSLSVQSSATCNGTEDGCTCQVCHWEGKHFFSQTCYDLLNVYNCFSELVGHRYTVGCHLLCLLQLWRLVQFIKQSQRCYSVYRNSCIHLWLKLNWNQ